MKIEQLEAKAQQIRLRTLDLIYQHKMGHLGSDFSCIDILVALYYDQLQDHRYVQSKGHAVEGLWAILEDLDYITKEEVDTYCQFGSRIMGHPNNKVKGIEVNTGSLGHGLSIGVGMALAAKQTQTNQKAFVLLGDGELAEGSVWEAAMAGAHFKLDNLVAILDRNHLQISGNTEDVMALRDVCAKWEAFGWKVIHVENGNDMSALIEALSSPALTDHPTMIVAETTKGKGVSFMENQAGWHHRVPSEDEYQRARQELGGSR